MAIDPLRDRRVDMLDAFIRHVVALVTDTPFDSYKTALSGLAASHPTVAVRSHDDAAARIAPLLQDVLPASELVVADHFGKHPSGARDSSPAQCDWNIVVVPVFAARDPAWFAMLDAMAAGMPSRTTVLVDGIDRIDGAVSSSATARLIGESYEGDPALRLCSRRFVPVSVDLWACASEVGDSDAHALATLAIGSADALSTDLGSATRFVGGDDGRAGALRRRVLDRLGMVGLRCAMAEPGALRSGADLRGVLLAASGAPTVSAAADVELVRDWPRPRELRVAATVARLVDELQGHDRALARDLRDAMRRFEQTSEAVVGDTLRLWRELTATSLRPDWHHELWRVTEGSTLAERVGTTPDASPDELLAEAARGSERWRSLAASPLVDPSASILAEAVARWYELVCLIVAPSTS